MSPDPVARRRALWAARAILESYALAHQFDPGLSRILDAIAHEEDTMNERLDAALTPEAFDYPSCCLCGKPAPGGPTLTDMLRPPGLNEPDPTVRYVMHDTCSQSFAQIDHSPEVEAEWRARVAAYLGPLLPDE